jgi:hypothetical protein
MLWTIIFIVVYVKMRSYMTRYGNIHENGIAWHGLVRHGRGMEIHDNDMKCKWHGNGMA